MESMDVEIVESLKVQAREVRRHTIETIACLGVGHIGGSLSVVEILTLLYYREMQVKPEEPRWKLRDKLVLSKGHAGPALYAVLALKGFFPMDWLKTLNQGGTNLPSHCDRNRTPGIDMTTGSLGQGLSAACGLAIANRLDGIDSWVYVIIGDGESNEGQNWEAAMLAPHQRLDHIIAFTDYNKLQLDGTTDQILSLGDIEGKWRTFGWYVDRCDGHDFEAMSNAIAKAKAQAISGNGKPTMIILDTIKGKGAAFAEGLLSNHNMNIDRQTADAAIAALYEEK
jgi:transketolase